MAENYFVRKSGEEGKECLFLLPTTLPLGEYHDILMAEKGWCIERMIANQKAEDAVSQKMKEISEQQEKECSSCDESQ